MINNDIKIRKIPSTIQRSRLSVQQVRIFHDEFERYCLASSNLPALNENFFQQIFKRTAKLILDIGFGNGEQLIELACQLPAYNFIGVELYKKGIINLITKIKLAKINNLKIIYGDIKEIMPKFDDNYIDKIQIFFPDPWPKLRHYKRRLINVNFLHMLKAKLCQTNGILHIATDSEDYSKDMLKQLAMLPQFKLVEVQSTNQSGYQNHTNSLISRSSTKFAKIAISLGKKIWDIVVKL